VLKDEAQVRRDRIVPQHRVTRLKQVVDAQGAQSPEHNHQSAERPVCGRRDARRNEGGKPDRKQSRESEDDETSEKASASMRASVKFEGHDVARPCVTLA